MKKHYTVKVCEKPPKGKFLRYEAIFAENKSELKKLIEDKNKASKDEYIPLKSAWVLH